MCPELDTEGISALEFGVNGRTPTTNLLKKGRRVINLEAYMGVADGLVRARRFLNAIWKKFDKLTGRDIHIDTAQLIACGVWHCGVAV